MCLSDHGTVETQPLQRSQIRKPKRYIKSRDLRPTKRLAMRKYLEEVDVKSIIDTERSCERKTQMLESVINFGLDTLLPLKTKITFSNEPPWMSQSLKQLIRRRQRALNQSDRSIFRALRNQVNRERKTCRAKFYKSKVEHLKNCSPAAWWKEVKKLSGMAAQVSGREDPMSHLHNIECGPGLTRTTAEDLANIINQTFLEPMKAFDPLPSSPNNQSIERNSETF